MKVSPGGKYGKIRRKKLLIVSSDSSDESFVEAAKALGVYVVCCDKYSDYKVSPAKALADEAWDMDYSDTDAVAKNASV